ncbi:hypothetical protein LCI18_007867 [Fusarium solani-melongenae]|uniref:Uncharacterized protein n=1 Tax=Fusarium solani subsp. cucurbitae TaxID=2747967 RepID=A0ACD3Z6U8_FUSSC|nr:hypothetical protein LCI18_007867 [Fusarium solani-melongenae]
MPLKPAISALARQTLKTAYDELDRTIAPGDKQDFGTTTLQHVRKAVRDIENQLGARQSLRNMGRLMPLFQGLEHYPKVVEILCNGTPYLSWVWAPISLILRIACEYVEAFEQIIKGYASIAESLKRFEILSNAFIREPEFHETLAIFYADILKFHTHAYKFVRRSGWQLIFLTSWGRFERTFKHILEDLKEHGSLIDKEANARNIAEAKEMRENIQSWRKEIQARKEEIQARREESQSQLSREETEQSAKQFKAIASWLKINESDQLAIFDSISSEVAEYQGTCGWILENPKVRSWLKRKPDTPALWLQGSAGTGKSVLCTQLVNFMKRSNKFVIRHFCTYLYASSTAYEQILKSLILQLVQKDDDLVAHVYEAHVLEKKSPETTALEQLFQTLLANMSNEPSQEEYAWIIIDGLDECEPDKQTRLVRLINHVTSKHPLPGSTAYKVLISSRSPSNALQGLQRKQTVSLTEEKHSLHGAIGQYVGQRLRSLDPKLRQIHIRDAEINEIRNAIVTKADGMFLYARLVMDYLASNIFYSGDEIKQSVNQLPKKLAEFYDKILTQILVQLDPRSVDRIRCILSWVAFAKRPLRKLEFFSVITFSPGDPEVEHLAPQYILDICGTIVEERQDSTLAFIHISVKEFLQSSSSNIVIYKQQALREHGVATVTCLLSGLRVFGREFPEHDRVLRIGKGLHGFHVYATEYWIEYLLSHIAGADGIDTNSPEPLMILACQLADVVKESSPEMALENDGRTSQLDERLPALRQYPTLYTCVTRALMARSLKNLEARILQEHGKLVSQGISTPSASSKPSFMLESITALLASYQGAVMSLVDHDHFPGLTRDELELFRAHFGTAALTCRLGSCPRATVGFETKRLRSDHEMSHVRCFPCTFSDCQYPPFGSAKALKKHTSKYHAVVTGRKTIRRTGSRRVQRGQQQSTPSSFDQDPMAALTKKVYERSLPPTPHVGPLSSRTTTEQYEPQPAPAVYGGSAPSSPLVPNARAQKAPIHIDDILNQMQDTQSVSAATMASPREEDGNGRQHAAEAIYMDWFGSSCYDFDADIDLLDPNLDLYVPDPNDPKFHNAAAVEPEQPNDEVKRPLLPGLLDMSEPPPDQRSGAQPVFFR